jgi:hypothetical protein
MWRRIAVGGSGLLSLVAALCGGCGSDGNYQVTWNFFASPGAIAANDLTEDASSACGAHGVDAIRVSAVNPDGDRHETTGLCTQGQLAAGIGLGEWQFTFYQLDGKGDVIPPPEGVSDPQSSAKVESKATADLAPVTFVPRPACADEVDNDHDGRVDLDDPGCAGDPARDSESALD